MYFSGVMNEVLLYTGVLSATDRSIMQSYLALKYGITLPAQNYYLSNLTTTWNYSSNSAYHNRVFGISRDSTLSLDQRVATSTATGSVVTFAYGTTFTGTQTGATQLTNNTAILFGDNGSTTGSVLLSGIIYRLNRAWKVSEI